MKEQLSKLIKNPVAISAIVGSISFGAGTAVGYILGKRNRYEIFEPPPRVGLVLDANDLKDIESNDHYSKEAEVEKDEEQDRSGWVVNDKVSAEDFITNRLRTPILVGEEVVNVEVEVEPEVEPEPDPEPVAVNVFASEVEGWDFPEELAKRNPTAPYVIHRDEFWAEESGYHQSTLTWYDGDNTLVDEEDSPVYNYNEVIGDRLFGHGSGDPHVFYVRNDRLHAEYEILYDEGRFQVKVLGLDEEDNAEAQDAKRSNGLKKFSSAD